MCEEQPRPVRPSRNRPDSIRRRRLRSSYVRAFVLRYRRPLSSLSCRGSVWCLEQFLHYNKTVIFCIGNFLVADTERKGMRKGGE